MLSTRNFLKLLQLKKLSMILLSTVLQSMSITVNLSKMMVKEDHKITLKLVLKSMEMFKVILKTHSSLVTFLGMPRMT